MQIHNGDIALHVAVDGDAAHPPILLLHGITSSSRTWDWLVPSLAERFRVLRLDFRGHGQSARAPEAYDADGYISDAVAALEQAAGQPCPVIGHSLGGITAAALAQRHTDRVTAVVMEDPPLQRPAAGTAPSLEGNALLDGFRLMRESIPQIQAGGMPLDVLTGVLAAAPDTTRTATFGDMLFADGIESMAAGLLAVDATVLDPVLNGTSLTFLDTNAGFGVPSLLVTADPSKPDAAAQPDAANWFAANSPDARLVVATGAGHLIHDERRSRDMFRDAVLGFLDKLPR